MSFYIGLTGVLILLLLILIAAAYFLRRYYVQGSSLEEIQRENEDTRKRLFKDEDWMDKK